MRPTDNQPRGVAWAVLAAVLLAASGCEVDSWIYDPSVTGRWERTPVQLPILKQLDVIDEPSAAVPGLSQVQPEDLIPQVREYVIGTGDLLTISIFELRVPGVESVQTRQVNELGIIRLPVVGTVKADGHTPSGLEKFIAKVLADKEVLKDATVTVIVQQARQNTYSILGEPGQGTTAFGTFGIPGPDFRLLDALAAARGVPGRTRRLFIFRSVPLTEEVAGEVPSEPAEREGEEPVPEEVPKEPEDLLKELFEEGIEELMPGPMLPPEPQAAPPALERGLDESVQVPRWVNIEGKWVKVTPEVAAAPQPAGEEAVITQRIIEIPFQELFNGDMRYNVVIRPGDIIKVPARSAGFVYIGGAINRSGAFTVPGERELTITQLVTSAGGLSALAIPERVDLRRRIGEDQEVIVRINVRRIFEGTQPNIFLKANDELQVGTSFVASPLAVLRNGFRFSYGFGFILDRNFGPQLYDGR